MIKSVNNYPISQLFDIDSSLVYAIPRYQREYTWGKTQWEALFDDIQENDPGYFLGSVICINQSVDSLDIQRLEVVDGQQRLTTLSLLFAALYSALIDLKADLDDEQQHELMKLKRKLVLKKNDQLRVIPQAQNNNLEDYRSVLADLGLVPADETPANAGNRKVVKAFRHFKGRIREMVAEKPEPACLMVDYLTRVNQACLVKIEVDSHADAYTLFESLNNRGTPLTAIDLIKNKLLASLEKNEPGKVDEYFKAWKRLLDYLGDDYAVQERFFRQYYNAFKDELNAPFRSDQDKRKDPLGPIATRSNIIHIYEKLIHHDAKQQLEKLTAAGKLYALMLSRNPDEAWKGLEKSFRDLERIQGAPSYLLMLYLLVRATDLDLATGHLEKILRFLVSFFVRRNLTDTPPTYDLSRLFMSLVEKVAPLQGDKVFQVIRDDLLAVSAPDAQFRSRLMGPIYEENFGVTRFVLSALAEQSMTKESWVDLWRVENKLSVWTVEHIFPQGENIPAAWVDMIANGDSSLARQIQQDHVHKLGNLTITAFNSALGNKSFEEKRDRTDRQGRSVGYRNGLKLNEDLAKSATWSVEQIDIRTEKLVEQVMNTFPLSATTV